MEDVATICSNVIQEPDRLDVETIVSISNDRERSRAISH